jgi:hypothetical protein
MTDEINGFAVELCSSNRYLFRRLAEPRHEYIFEITSKRIVLRATLPHDVGLDRRNALDDAERSEKDARKAAEEFQRGILGCEPERAGSTVSCAICGPEATLAAFAKLRTVLTRSYRCQLGSVDKMH